jgi:hypothetical protein
MEPHLADSHVITTRNCEEIFHQNSHQNFSPKENRGEPHEEIGIILAGDAHVFIVRKL